MDLAGGVAGDSDLWSFAIWPGSEETCFVGPTAVDQRMMGGMGGDANMFPWDTLTNKGGVVHDSATTATTATTMTTLANVDGLYGAYRPLGPPSPMTNQKKAGANTNGRSFLLVDRPALSRSSSSFFGWMRFILGSNGWPSIAIVAHRVSAWSRRLPLVPSSDTSSFPHGRIEFQPKTEQWCLTTAKHGEGADDQNLMVCSDPSSSEATQNVDKDVIHVLPPSGIWKGTHPANGSTTLAVQVTCPGPSTIPMEGVASSSNAPKKGNVSSKRNDKIKGMEQQLFRKNPGKKQDVRRKEALEQLLVRPATCFLLALNVYLAFCYWNRRTSPSLVAKIYRNICVDGEWWRSFTGALAHFEPLHLFFNMSSLYTMGHQLESSLDGNDHMYSSISFLFYNISLIPITTCFMMALIYLQIKYKTAGGNNNSERLMETSTVGYSGVLFAWMVIVSLERPNTCPIPFLPDMCFETYTLLGGFFKFNLSPMVQLMVCQFIMPRVSLVGHLAGILAGFFLHWNILPPDLMGNPALLIPTLFWIHLRYVRKILPVHRSNDDDDDDDSEVTNEVQGLQMAEWGNRGGTQIQQSGTRSLDPRAIRLERNASKHQLLGATRFLMCGIAIVSMCVVDVLGSLMMGHVMALAFFHSAVQAHTRIDNRNESKDTRNKEKGTVGTIWKGYILSCILLLVTDSMAVAGWMVSQTFILADRRVWIGLVPAVGIMIIRISIHLVGLALATKSLSDLGETGGGIFVSVFGWPLQFAKPLGGLLFSNGAVDRTGSHLRAEEHDWEVHGKHKKGRHHHPTNRVHP
eukprot:CAMPEP_0198288936 /NCGR_PEP_ID=MMETSP1449-20131203/7295_1 /TAXON_ID=420275 /ORGANISM="Attheya septentrionalis, Strain CCMP2084" /LENGTH=800 /DNA_ID=CAMNT_0043987181 /DNA_START=288 /DNA_END=2688 /DNA_ORIENTATION=+